MRSKTSIAKSSSPVSSASRTDPSGFAPWIQCAGSIQRVVIKVTLTIRLRINGSPTKDAMIVVHWKTVDIDALCMIDGQLLLVKLSSHLYLYWHPLNRTYCLDYTHREFRFEACREYSKSSKSKQAAAFLPELDHHQLPSWYPQPKTHQTVPNKPWWLIKAIRVFW